jgi:hypothetical protein
LVKILFAAVETLAAIVGSGIRTNHITEELMGILSSAVLSEQDTIIVPRDERKEGTSTVDVSCASSTPTCFGLSGTTELNFETTALVTELDKLQGSVKQLVQEVFLSFVFPGCHSHHIKGSNWSSKALISELQRWRCDAFPFLPSKA